MNWTVYVCWEPAWRQIAWHCAYMGKQVAVHDPFEGSLKRCQEAHENYAGIYAKDLGADEAALAATRKRLSFFTEIGDAAAGADLVIESIPEIPEIKKRAYTNLAPHLPPHTLIATNCSTLLPRDFAAATGRPEKFCALHFANMIWALNIAAIMAHPGTALETLEAVTAFAIEIGQVPIPVRKEQNGYVHEHMVRGIAQRGANPRDGRGGDARRRGSLLYDRQPWLQDGADGTHGHGRHEDHLRHLFLLGGT